MTSIDWDDRFCPPCLKRDVYSVSLDEMLEYDVIWASPDCTTYSVASGGLHRYKDPYTKELKPKTDYAKYCDENNEIFINHLKTYAKKCNGLFWVENPRGGMRSMPWMSGIDRYTVTYCQYGDFRMKPTDIWTNCKETWFKQPCKNGDPCHVSSPRGSYHGTCSLSRVDRSRIPSLLCDAIVAMSENYYA